MFIISKIVRKISNTTLFLNSKFRVFCLKLKYPGIVLENVFIENSVSIIKENSASLTIKNSFIKKGSIIHASLNSELVINSSFIGCYCVIVAQNKIIIDNLVEIAEFCVIRDQDHDLFDKRKFNSAPIIINRNVWLGNKVTITKGVVLGAHSVVGANSVVTKSFPQNVLIGGVPARIIRNLKS